MASDSASGEGSPFGAESAEESAAVVGVVGEAVGVAADLLGEHVGVLDSTVRRAAGAVVGEDQIEPAVDGAGQTTSSATSASAQCWKNTIRRRRA